MWCCLASAGCPSPAPEAAASGTPATSSLTCHRPHSTPPCPCPPPPCLAIPDSVVAPQGTMVLLREPLMPFEALGTTGKATGGRIIKRARKKGARATQRGGGSAPDFDGGEVFRIR